MDALERDRLASDLAIPLTQLAGLLCGMRKYTGAAGDDWLHWIDCLDQPANEIASVLEAAMDGEGTYNRVLGPGTMASLVGNPEAFQQRLADAIAGTGVPLSPADARKAADAVVATIGTAAQPADQFVRGMPTEDLMAELQRRVSSSE